jgi:hypothetical protein
MKFYDSHEAEMLKKLISDKEMYLKKATNEFHFKKLQKEILFLKNDLLPIVLNNTNIVHSEVSKIATMAFETALRFKVNGLLFYIPIDENYSQNFQMGILNPRSLMKFGTPGAIEIYTEIIIMDGNGSKIECSNLPLDLLM